MTSVKPELVVMAAGLGSRYGGLKQLEPVGPGGERLLDYSVYDAWRAGVERVVFVIRRETERDFHAAFGATFARRLEVVYAFQELADLPVGFAVPAGRSKPWGTGHAVRAAAASVHASFLVINADDFYGRTAFATLASFLAGVPAGETVPTWALVAFELAKTLSAHGTVSRGVCQVEPGGLLRSVDEWTALATAGEDARQTDEGGGERLLPGTTPVSMNCWGFTPELFPALEGEFVRFLERHGGEPKSEFFLPAVVARMIERGRARVRVLTTGDRWVGMTHPQDREATMAHLRALVAAGEYPARLWTADDRR